MPVVSKGIWSFRASSVTFDNGVGSIRTLANDVVFRIETLLSNIGVPSGQLKKIAEYFGGRQNPITKQYLVSCDLLTAVLPVNLILTINGRTYEIPPASYIINGGQAPTCVLNFFETSKDWILGQTFLELFDTIYDASANLIGISG